ncbi:MAG: tellurite resistance/C4-dicarboxylate transporter family protein [Candidatus Dormibacteraeota bacterium]|nr:tellurite resistance/C4-dicarboxylate transporter family protein [Candidatus Dormibacteraeota bacterium]
MSEQRLGARLEQSLVADLDPACFAFVMATGIVSTGTLVLGLSWISIPLLPIAAAGYLLLCVLTAWRLVRFPGRVLGDASNEARAFGFFTFVAGGNVLGVRLDAAGLAGPALALMALSAAAWVLLTYGLVARLAVVPGKPGLGAASGAWLLWVVSTQSVGAAAAALASDHASLANGFAFVAAGMWAVGIVLYLVLIAIIVARLLLVDLTPEQLTHPYWVAMGATAITVLTAARILGLHARLPIPSPVESGLTFVLWAFGSWWIPLLLVLGLWRYLLRRFKLTYQVSLWSIVFPLGMYATASEAFGVVAGIPVLIAIARVEVWFAVAAWLLTLVAMLAAVRHLFPRRTFTV